MGGQIQRPPGGKAYFGTQVEGGRGIIEQVCLYRHILGRQGDADHQKDYANTFSHILHI